MTREQALEAALNAIAVRASCAPNDDAEKAGAEFTKIMNIAYTAIATPHDNRGLPALVCTPRVYKTSET